ncbi:MAG TPA: TPM domain-containing protein [Candidatus Binatia bacterium]|nr:TPM domain-containing protein [Candidatus Binatia bacterium]
MKLRKARMFFAGLALLLAPTILSLAMALDVPPLRGRINDYAGLIPTDRARALEERLARFEAETGHQIAVFTIPSLKGDSLEDFSIRVAETWKIGKKGFDNGAILLVARDDRRLRIEVGYGLEGVMPDAIASRIIREVITPRFRSGDYAGGIEAGVDAILKITKGETLPERTRPAPGPTASQGASLITILMITAMLALFIGMTRRRLLGGTVGGAASGLVTSLFASGGLGFVLLPALIVGALLGAIGAALGTGSAGNQWVGRSRSRRGDWGGGTFPGGFGGGGGGGGGGFSGGGGGFGGGGASGSW